MSTPKDSNIVNLSQQLELDIQEKGLTAPRLTPDDIENTIVSAEYHVFRGTTTMACCLKLRNGFTVVGVSACVSPENFDNQIGMKVAREDAKRKIWQLEGYLLTEKLNSEREDAK